jgi:hypothetical protein
LDLMRAVTYLGEGRSNMAMFAIEELTLALQA